MVCKTVSEARCGAMRHVFNAPLMLIGIDEYYVYLVDCTRTIQGLPYVHVFAKEWEFKEADTHRWFRFEYEAF